MISQHLGGNGLNCEVEFRDDHRNVYQNTKWSHSEPQYAPDGTDYESRFDKRQESEANLLKRPLNIGPVTACVPDGPGLGVELDEAQLEKYRNDSDPAQGIGSVTSITFEG